jgi:hypothetical protein
VPEEMGFAAKLMEHKVNDPIVSMGKIPLDEGVNIWEKAHHG